MMDFGSRFGRTVSRRLKSEKIVWLTTVGPDGTPQPRPVWFYWDGASLLIYSQPQGRKLDYIRRQPIVALNLNTDPEGSDVAARPRPRVLGTASLAEDAPPADKHGAYRRKVRRGIADLDMTPGSFARDYSGAIRVTPEKLRGF